MSVSRAFCNPVKQLHFLFIKEERNNNKIKMRQESTGKKYPACSLEVGISGSAKSGTSFDGSRFLPHIAYQRTGTQAFMQLHSLRVHND